MATQRLERVAGEVRAVIGDILAREQIKDPRVRGAGLITVTHVTVSGDLSHARVLFMVHGLAEPALERVREGLDHASGFFRSAVARRLRTRISPVIKFEIDRVFEQATRIENLLHEMSRASASAAPAVAEAAGLADESEEGDDTDADVAGQGDGETK
jgi:ribosome-binding factor A